MLIIYLKSRYCTPLLTCIIFKDLKKQNKNKRQQGGQGCACFANFYVVCRFFSSRGRLLPNLGRFWPLLQVLMLFLLQVSPLNTQLNFCIKMHHPLLDFCPMSNTCINYMKLPLHVSYQAFKESIQFALGNTKGFG